MQHGTFTNMSPRSGLAFCCDCSVCFSLKDSESCWHTGATATNTGQGFLANNYNINFCVLSLQATLLAASSYLLGAVVRNFIL